MSLPCSTAVGCVVQVRLSKSLSGTDDSHGQSPSKVCPSTPGVVGGIRPAVWLYCVGHVREAPQLSML